MADQIDIGQFARTWLAEPLSVSATKPLGQSESRATALALLIFSPSFLRR
jgi:hypothetical protein